MIICKNVFKHDETSEQGNIKKWTYGVHTESAWCPYRGFPLGTLMWIHYRFRLKLPTIEIARWVCLWSSQMCNISVYYRLSLLQCRSSLRRMTSAAVLVNCQKHNMPFKVTMDDVVSRTVDTKRVSNISKRPWTLTFRTRRKRLDAYLGILIASEVIRWFNAFLLKAN